MNTATGDAFVAPASILKAMNKQVRLQQKAFNKRCDSSSLSHHSLWCAYLRSRHCELPAVFWPPALSPPQRYWPGSCLPQSNGLQSCTIHRSQLEDLCAHVTYTCYEAVDITWSVKKAGLDVIKNHLLGRTSLFQYQASSSMLGWPRVGDHYLMQQSCQVAVLSICLTRNFFLGNASNILVFV